MDFQIVIDALTRIFTDIVTFLPNLINGLIIIFVGYTVSRFVRWAVRVVLQRLHTDTLVERSGLTAALRNLGVQVPLSVLVSQVVFVLMLLSFLTTATRLMGLEAVAVVLEQAIALLPKGVAAFVVFLLGGLIAQFLGNLIAASATAAGLSYASRLGRLVQYIIIVFVAVLALGVLGIETALLITTLTILVAAFGLALGLALGLGARPVVLHILAGYYLRQRFPVGRAITVDQVEGEIRGLGGVNALVATQNEDLVVPNGWLLEQIVRLPRQSAPSDAGEPGSDESDTPV